MAVQKVSIGSSNGYVVAERDTALFFDPPSVIRAENPRVRQLSGKLRYVEIEVQKKYPSNATAIFLSSSDSLGVFFTESSLPIYTTEMVYMQMKEKLKHYVSLGPVKQEHPRPAHTEHTEIREVCTHKSIRRRVRMVSFFQLIKFVYLSVGVQPGGTNLGWPMYFIMCGSNALLAYASGAPGTCSLSLEMPLQHQRSPLLLNRMHIATASDLSAFSARAKRMGEEHKLFFIGMNVMNHGAEMVLHLLSLIRDARIYVCHPGFRKVLQYCELKRRLLSQKFAKSVNISTASMLSPTSRVVHVSTGALLRNLPPEKAIVICEVLEYYVFFGAHPAINMERYSVKFFGDLSDALAIPWASEVLLPREYTSILDGNSRAKYVGNESVQVEDPNGEKNYPIRISQTHHVKKVAESEGTMHLHLRARFVKTSAEIVLQCEEPPLHRISLEHPRYVLDGSVVYRLKEGIVKVLENKSTVIIKGESRKRKKHIIPEKPQ